MEGLQVQGSALPMKRTRQPEQTPALLQGTRLDVGGREPAQEAGHKGQGVLIRAPCAGAAGVGRVGLRAHNRVQQQDWLCISINIKLPSKMRVRACSDAGKVWVRVFHPGNAVQDRRQPQSCLASDCQHALACLRQLHSPQQEHCSSSI